MGLGVVYCVTGSEKYLIEATISARSVKRHMPDVSVTLFTDADKTALAWEAACFDDVKLAMPHNEQRPFASRINAYERSTYARTLALDTDTLVLQPIHEVFELLDHFDLAAVPLPFNRPQDGRYRTPTVPDAYTEFNCGVLAYRPGEVGHFFSAWHKKYMDDPYGMARKGSDQIYFREELYSSGLQVAVMPLVYNQRFYHGENSAFHDIVAWWDRNNAVVPTKILHDRVLIQHALKKGV